jgi:hypothetical protein
MLIFPRFTDTLPEATLAAGKDVRVPAPHPPEFRQRAVELARLRERPIREIAAYWASASRVCATGSPSRHRHRNQTRLSSDEREELAQLRRDKRRLELENETSHAG